MTLGFHFIFSLHTGVWYSLNIVRSNDLKKYGKEKLVHLASHKSITLSTNISLQWLLITISKESYTHLYRISDCVTVVHLHRFIGQLPTFNSIYYQQLYIQRDPSPIRLTDCTDCWFYIIIAIADDTALPTKTLLVVVCWSVLEFMSKHVNTLPYTRSH